MVRRESANTQVFESCQLNDEEVDMDEENEDFLASFPLRWAGRQDGMNPISSVGKKGFKYHDIASVMVEDNVELHTIIVGRDCYNLRKGERKEPIVNSRLWKLLVFEKRSRGKCAAGFVAHGLGDAGTILSKLGVSSRRGFEEDRGRRRTVRVLNRSRKHSLNVVSY